MSLAKEHEKGKNEQNKDIKQLVGKDQNIGVGSVVLHLRKQRVGNSDEDFQGDP